MQTFIKNNFTNGVNNKTLIDYTVPKEYDLFFTNDTNDPQFKKYVFEYPMADIIQSELSLTEIQDYFLTLKNTSNIRLINGIPPIKEYNDLTCDYCHEFMSDDVNEYVIYHYCIECQKDLCDYCLKEVDDIKHNARGWQKRRKQLNKCRANHTIIDRVMNGVCEFHCDKCKKQLNDTFYSNVENVGLKDGYDLCMECCSTGDIDKYQLVLFKNDIPDDNNMMFGSILDWIPVIKDDTYEAVLNDVPVLFGNHILINLNKESKYYLRLCAQSVDYKGMIGFGTLPKDITLEMVKEELKTFVNNESEGWNKFYNAPIKQYMDKYNICFHYSS